MSGADRRDAAQAGRVRKDLPEQFAAGPVERDLSARIAAHLATTDAPSAEVELELSPPGSSRLGDFRFDASVLCGPDGVTNKALVAILKRLPELDGARVLFPWAYVTATTEFLHDTVFGAVSREGGSYGGDDGGGGRRVVLSFSDPNLNKPLHVGHLRNNVVGMALSSLLEAMGFVVERQAVHSDWGRHICQALVMQLRREAEGVPASPDRRGDEYAGELYQAFHEARVDDPALDEAAASLLVRMEADDHDVLDLGARFTAGVEKGILGTYRRIGSRFDAIHHESRHRATAHRAIEQALAAGALSRQADGSVYLLSEQLDPPEVYLVRRDGTLLVIGQLIGVDIDRFDRTDLDRIVQLQGREWESGNVAYAELVDRLELPWGELCQFVFHGVVRLEGSKMKSRAGSGVSADALLDRLRERIVGSLPGLSVDDGETLAVASAKWHLLRARCRQDVDFDEERLFDQSVQTVVSFASALAFVRSGAGVGDGPPSFDADVRRLAVEINGFPRAVKRAVDECDPSYVARLLENVLVFAERVSKKGASPEAMAAVDVVVRRGLGLLNIELPESAALPEPQPRELIDIGSRGDQ